jgi:hypothetical protein
MALGQAIDTLNGAQVPPRIEVSFGPKDHQLLSVEVASMLLTLFRERDPARFGALLGEVMTGERPSGGRSRRSS